MRRELETNLPGEEATAMRPLARTENLLKREIDGEVVVYDLERDKAHCLNPTAAAVFRLADGTRNVDALARDLHDELGVPEDEGVVLLALDRLREARLLDLSVDVSEARGYTRRQALERLGVGAAAAGAMLPVVKSLLAPTAAQAAGSCLDPGEPCTDGQQCCSAVCDTEQGVCL